MQEILEKLLLESQLFHTEKIPLMMAKFRSTQRPFQRMPSHKVLEGKTMLTVDEKKSLGLNTRMKYSHDFIELCQIGRFKDTEPKAALDTILLNAYHRSSRNKTIKELRLKEFVTGVKVVSMGCSAATKLDKIYALDQVPKLPADSCDEGCCMCYFEPVLKL